MARTHCLIEFDNNPQKVFYGGQLLSGRVTLTLHKEKTVRGISIKILGRAYCRWTEGSGDSKRTYIGDECYLEERTYFLGDKSGEIVLQPGVYFYTFQCLLPAGLPTSVEGDHGYIRYSATVNLDRPMWPDQEFEEGFTVLKPLNLNDLPHLRCPLDVEKRKTFSLCCLLCCCCQSDPAFITARLLMTGFTSGQTIQLRIETANASDTAILSYRVWVEKNITFQSSGNGSKKKIDTITVCEKTTSQGCLPKASESMQIELAVPAIPPTDTTTSTICKVEYCLKIKGVVSGCHSDPELTLPITIGTVPFYTQPIGFAVNYPQPVPLAPYPHADQSYPVISQPPQPLQMNMPMPPMPMPPWPLAVAQAAADQPTAPPYDPMSLYTDCEPPTYEQAISGQVDIQGKMFAPFYPVFRNSLDDSNRGTGAAGCGDSAKGDPKHTDWAS